MPLLIQALRPVVECVLICGGVHRFAASFFDVGNCALAALTLYRCIAHRFHGLRPPQEGHFLSPPGASP